ncbi:hypothetical protein DRW41_09780 [Neobacillus piezotolerans]|uniref:Uncharacterized protein n=1 Tax=Neobacillus piezotolerans TaxID=2259171 RepID=A0A3D8GRM6_9BACI|nr:DUF6544 family protein [Neobacillus piezotolerans]RDU36977.1 hypothetical protein DRW41_09780 [Neobacillus piezotolerans]
MQKWKLVSLAVAAIILLAIIVLPRIAKIIFIKQAEESASSLLKNSNVEGSKPIDRNDLQGLPSPVQKWLLNSNAVGKERITTVRLKQEGQMRTKKDGPWMPIKADQYYTVDEPGFVWIADVRMAPFVHLSGIDTFKSGKGSMKIKLFSLIPVVNANAAEIDSGTLMRYLAEIPWFPSAALDPNIKWEGIDNYSAKATIGYKGITVSGIFTFTKNGDIESFKGKRYREMNGKYELNDWGGRYKGAKEFDGWRIPEKATVIWFEEDGEFNWYEARLSEIEYNKPEIY